MLLTEAEPLRFYKHHDAEVLKAEARGVLIPTPAAFATAGNGEYAVIHQCKARRVDCSSGYGRRCFNWPEKADLPKGKFDSGLDRTIYGALRREMSEECRYDWEKHRTTCVFLGYLKIKTKKVKYGEYQGLEHKLWCPYLVIIPDQKCLQPGSHAVTKIEWRSDPENAFKVGSGKREAVAQIMSYLRRHPQPLAA